jgi:hypothetical protein
MLIDTSVKLDSPAQGGCIDDNDEHAASDEQKKRIQQIVGVLLYYARPVDPTIIVRVSKLSNRNGVNIKGSREGHTVCSDKSTSRGDLP